MSVFELMSRSLRESSIVVDSTNSPRPRSQNIGLSVPPDLPDDPLPLLQPLRSLQLLSRRKHVPTQCPVRSDQVVVYGDFCGAMADGGLQASCIFLLLFIFALLILFAIVFELFFLRCGGSRGGARLAGDPDDQETESEHQAKTHADDEVKAKTLWICWKAGGKKFGLVIEHFNIC